jgi:DNA-binding phage protein
VIAEYLTAAAEDEDQNVLLAALADVAKARGMARVSVPKRAIRSPRS